MSIFDTIKEFLGGQVEEVTQNLTNVQESLPDAGQVVEDATAAVDEAKQNITDNLPQ